MVKHAAGVSDRARALTSLLQDDFDARTVRVSAGNSVNCLYYMRLLGRDTRLVPSDLREVFDKFDDLVAKAMDVGQNDIDNIERYFEEAFANRTLSVRNGCIVRARIERHFRFRR